MREAISQRVSVGGQPQQSDLEELKKDGVTTVVNLRVAGEDTSLTPAEERALAEKLGLQYHHLPISLDKLDPAQVKELRAILGESQEEDPMSFLPRISPEGYEELFRLFAAGRYLIGPTPKEILESQKQLQHRLNSIWDAVDPKPPGMNFSDFRHSVV